MAESKAKIFNEVSNKTRVDFDTIKFNGKVWEKGLDIEWYKMIMCPCKKEVSSQAVSNCVNCKGTGFYWFDKKDTRGLISGASLSKRSLDWSATLEGSIYLSVDSFYKLGWYDKIVVKDAETVFSETQKIITSGTDKKINLKYKPLSMIKVLKYVDADSALEEIDVDGYTISNNSLIITDTITNGESISVLYTYNPTYLIIDLLNDYRNTYEKHRKPTEELKNAPIRVLAKKMHLVLE